MRKIFSYLLVSLLSFIPAFSFAHPGHGATDGYSIKHYFVEPCHLITSFSVIVLTIVLIRSFQRKNAN